MNLNVMKSLCGLVRSRMVLNGGLGAISGNTGRCLQTLPRYASVAQARFYSKQTGPTAAASTATAVKDGDIFNSKMHTKKPSDRDKRILVWYGKYPSVEEVPEFVSSTSLNKAKDKFRAYITAAVCFATFAIGMAVIYVDHRSNYKKHHPELQAKSK